MAEAADCQAVRCRGLGVHDANAVRHLRRKSDAWRWAFGEGSTMPGYSRRCDEGRVAGVRNAMKKGIHSFSSVAKRHGEVRDSM